MNPDRRGGSREGPGLVFPRRVVVVPRVLLLPNTGRVPCQQSMGSLCDSLVDGHGLCDDTLSRVL